MSESQQWREGFNAGRLAGYRQGRSDARKEIQVLKARLRRREPFILPVLADEPERSE